MKNSIKTGTRGRRFFRRKKKHSRRRTFLPLASAEETIFHPTSNGTQTRTEETNLPRKKARLLPRATKTSIDQTCLLPYGHQKRLKEKNEVRTLTYRAYHDCFKASNAGNGGRRARRRRPGRGEKTVGCVELQSRKKKNSKVKNLWVAEEEEEIEGGRRSFASRKKFSNRKLFH